MTRPDLADVSKGEFVTLDNFERLFKEILNPKQIEGLRLLFTPFPQQQFNLTARRPLLTLEDTVEFFNLVLGLKLVVQEKRDLVAFLRVL